MRTARVLDCDGTLIRKLGSKTLLETFLFDFYKNQHGIKALDLAFRALTVKSYRKLIRAFARTTNDTTLTGETTTLQVCDIVYIRPAQIPITFLKQSTARYAEQHLSQAVRDAIKKSSDDVYVVTAEPVQLINAMLSAAGLESCVNGVYGTHFRIEDGRIAGFERLGLFAGIRGKYIGLEKILARGYDQIKAIGDTKADIGLFENDRVTPYTFFDADMELQDYVAKRGGKVVRNLSEFFRS